MTDLPIDRAAADATRRHIRSSGLLLAGRLIAVVLNFAVQVLIVRHLAKAGYGAFAYALGVASISSSTILLGLGKALPRLLPIQQEKGDFGRAAGSVSVAAATVVGLGASLVVLTHVFRGVLGERVVTDPESLTLLLILICLAPIDALDEVLQQVVAVFASPRAIFWRRHVVGPALKLAAVLVVIAVAGDARMLAYGYVVGGTLGTALYLAVLARECRRAHLLRKLRETPLLLPVRELFGFSVPLLASELSILWRGALAVVMLEYLHSPAAVAEYRAVLPVAGLNLIVFEACAVLFVPRASRLFAHDDRPAINELYWRTALWVMLLTFPVMAVTCGLADWTAVLLFGGEYATAGPVLAILAAGHYVHAALGFNAAALRVHGKIQLIVASDILAAIVAIAGNVVLIPRYGALGAAVSTTSALVVHAACNHACLWVGRTGVNLVDRQFLKGGLVVGLAMAAFVASRLVAQPAPSVSVALIVLATVAVVRFTRREVAAHTMFPELLRVPGLRQLLT